MITITEKEFRACKNCVYFCDEGDIFLFCNKYTYEVGDVITGKIETQKTLCVDARSDGGPCGLDAYGYEPKITIDEPHRLDEPTSLLGHLKAFLFDRWLF